MLIAGDDQIGLSGDRAGEHMIVVGIARDGLRELVSNQCSRFVGRERSLMRPPGFWEGPLPLVHW
jgi:hypothetical protein